MRDPFNFGFNDLNHDGHIDACEAAYGFSIMDSIMHEGSGEEDSYNYGRDYEEEHDLDSGDDEDDDFDDDFDSDDDDF